MKRFMPWMILALALAPTPVLAAIPPTMSYQGVLTDNAGVVVPNGAHGFSFSIFNVPTGGSVLWGPEVHTGVMVTGGGFSVILGSVTPLTLLFDQQYYLDITVDGAPLIPRVTLTSSPYSLAPWTSSAANIYRASGNVGVGINPPVSRLHVDNQAVPTLGATQTITWGNNNVGSSNTTGLNLVATPHNAKGSQSAVLSQTAVNCGTCLQNGKASGRLGTSSGFDAQGAFMGVESYVNAEALHNSDGSKVSYGVGVYASSQPIGTLSLNSTGTYWVGGVYGQVAGIVNNTPANGAVAGVIGVNSNTGNATSYAGYFQGNVLSTGAYLTASDARYKRNIATLPHALETVSRLHGVRYDWRSDEFPNKSFPAGPQIGLIAQEVEKVLPEVVETDSRGYKAVDYAHVVAVLIEAVKELRVQNESLTSRVAALPDLERRLRDLQSTVQELLANAKEGGATTAAGVATPPLAPMAP